MDARRISALCLILPALPLSILLFTPENAATMPLWLALVVVGGLGFAGGGEMSSTAYLTTRYVGLRSFGQNYGIITAIMAGTAGIGPLIGGIIYDQTKSYELMLIGAIPLVIVSGLLVLTLGKFPVWQADGSKAPD
jgi:nitrate/nitrite transporter NarK